MSEWVALLRGVNVGGVTIRNAALAEVFRGLGFSEVRTVLASGNVVFSSDAAESSHVALRRRIESALRSAFDYEAWIVLATRAQVVAAIDGFPYDEHDADRQPWVIFCDSDATRDELVGATEGMDATADPVAPGRGVLYWNPAKGTTTDTAFAKVLARPAYRSHTTNRNLRTLRKLVG